MSVEREISAVENQPSQERGEVSVEEEDEAASSIYSSPPPYLPDQRVLCCDNNNSTHYYEAVVRKVKFGSDNQWSFFVHYQGWNSRWDRWASDGELVPDTPENRKTHLKPKEPAVSSPSKKRKTDSSSSTGRKRKSTDSAPKVVKMYEEYCELPFTLKTILVDENAYITRKGFDSPHFYDLEPHHRPARSVHVLPANVTVKQVLQHYLKKRGGSKQEDEMKREIVRRFCHGLGILFDEALPVCLLYPEEHPQYEFFRRSDATKDKRPCEIYGCEFLLRLFARLPYLLQAESESDMEVNGPLLGDLIVLLQKNRQSCFKPLYREPKYEELLDWEKTLADNHAAIKKKASTSANASADNDDNALSTEKMAISPVKKSKPSYASHNPNVQRMES